MPSPAQEGSAALLTQALHELGVDNPRALPAIDRRVARRRDALLQAKDHEAVVRLDEAFAVVSAHYWSVEEPAVRRSYQAKRAQRQASAQKRLQPMGWPDSWPVDEAPAWLEQNIPLPAAKRWASAGWPPGPVADFYRNGRSRLHEIRYDPGLAADILASDPPTQLGTRWAQGGVHDIVWAYAFESRGWDPDDVGDVGNAAASRAFLAARPLATLGAYMALGFTGEEASTLIDAGVQLSTLAGWTPEDFFWLWDWAGSMHAHLLDDVLRRWPGDGWEAHRELHARAFRT